MKKVIEYLQSITIKREKEMEKNDLKSQLNRLSRYCLILGIINFCIYTSNLFFINNKELRWISFAISFGSVFVIPLCFYGFNLSIQKVFIGIIDIWSIPVVVLPFFYRGIRVLFYKSFKNYEKEVLKLDNISIFADILLLTICLLICSYILKKKKFVYLAMVLLLCYFVIYFIWNDKVLFCSTDSTMVIYVFDIFYEIVICGGYFLLGIFLQHKKERCT